MLICSYLHRKPLPTQKKTLFNPFLPLNYKKSYTKLNVTYRPNLLVPPPKDMMEADCAVPGGFCFLSGG